MPVGNEPLIRMLTQSGLGQDAAIALVERLPGSPGGSSPVFNFASSVPANAATDLTTFDFADVQWDPAWTRINGADITIRPDGITFDVVTTGLYHVSFYNSVDAVADVSKPLSFAIFGGIYPGADGGGTWNDPGSQFQDNGAGSVIWQNEWKSLPITLTDPLSHDRECMLNFPNEPLRLLAGTSFRFRTGVQPFDESSFTGVAAVSINYSAAVSITRLA